MVNLTSSYIGSSLEIIGIVGPIRAGKTSIATMICTRYGFKLASNSAVLSKALDSIGVPSSRSSLQALGNTLFKELGDDLFARGRIAQLRKSPGPDKKRYVIDGIRYAEEVDTYRELSNFRLLAVHASENTCYERAIRIDNREKESDTNRVSFSELKNDRSEAQVPGLIEAADYVINNDGNLKSIEEKIELIMSELLAE